MAHSKISTFNRFNNEIKGVILTKKRVFKSLKVNRDIERSYEGLFLFSVTIFESYLEEVFICLLKQKLKGVRTSGILLETDFRINKNIPNKRIKEFVIGEKKGEYLDWIPYDKTIERAKRYLKDGKPFTMLGQNDIQVLNQIIALRNYIAHKSTESKKKLENKLGFKVLSVKHLLNKKHSGNNTYFDFFIISLGNISYMIQKDLKELK